MGKHFRLSSLRGISGRCSAFLVVGEDKAAVASVVHRMLAFPFSSPSSHLLTRFSWVIFPINYLPPNQSSGSDSRGPKSRQEHALVPLPLPPTLSVSVYMLSPNLPTILFGTSIMGFCAC